MSQTHAHPPKSHSSEKNVGTTEESTKEIEPIPAPESGPHAHSHAAHLHDDAGAITKPEGNVRLGAAPVTLRQPPQEISRSGKQHRD